MAEALPSLKSPTYMVGTLPKIAPLSMDIICWFDMWNVANVLQTHDFSLLFTTPHDFILAAFTISPTPVKVTVG